MSGRGASKAFILATIVINMLGVGLAWPILPKLIEELTPGGISEAAFVYGLIATVYALAQFAFSPLLGTLSDAVGRRPVLVLSQAGLAIDYLVMAVAPNLWWLVAARLVAGVLGATITTANAYMADISAPEDRSRNFGYVGAAFGIGFIIGPLFGGLLGDIDLRLPFFVAAVLAFANFLFGLLIIPESLSPDKRRPFRLSEANPLRALQRLTRFPVLYPLLVALFLTNIAQRGLEAIWVLYTEFRFGWDVGDAGLSLAFVGLMFVAVQGGLVGPVVRRFGEWTTVTAGFLLSTTALALYGIATDGWMVYPLIALHVLGNALAGPALNAICSRTVPETEQGLLQGILSSVNSLAIIIGPLSASMVLAAVTRDQPVVDLPGAWFIFGAVLFGTGFLIVARRKLAIAT